MRSIKYISRESIGHQSIPSAAFLPRSDWGLFKDCINAQTTLSGKKDCLRDYIAELFGDESQQ